MRDTDITDAALAARGRDRIEWAERAMPVLAAIRRRFAESRPLAALACPRLTLCSVDPGLGVARLVRS